MGYVCRRYDHYDADMKDSPCNQCREDEYNMFTNPAIKLRLKQAHRAGWEQAKAEAKLLSFRITGFKLIGSYNIPWWWHVSTFHEGGSNNDKILRVKESL